MRNDRLIATATHAPTHEHITSVEDLPAYLLREIESFFIHYNQLSGKRFKPLGQGSVARAQAVLDNGKPRWRGARHHDDEELAAERRQQMVCQLLP